MNFHIFHISLLLLAPVNGNFTEEEINGSTLPQDTLEYPLQRDEVQTIQSKGERNFVPQSMCYFRISIYCAIYTHSVRKRVSSEH